MQYPFPNELMNSKKHLYEYYMKHVTKHNYFAFLNILFIYVKKVVMKMLAFLGGIVLSLVV